MNDIEEQVAQFARQLFEQKRCPACLLLWGKVLGCGEGLGHDGGHRYNQSYAQPAELS